YLPRGLRRVLLRVFSSMRPCDPRAPHSFPTRRSSDLLLETVSGADLLILDDLGTEFNSSFVISTLYSLLNDRLGRRRPTILTTNSTDSTLLEKLYTEKVASRISAFVPYRFLAEDIRLI